MTATTDLRCPACGADYNPAIPAPTATLPCVCCGREMARHANITLASGRTFTHRRAANGSQEVVDPATGNMAEMNDAEWLEYCGALRARSAAEKAARHAASKAAYAAAVQEARAILAGTGLAVLDGEERGVWQE